MSAPYRREQPLPEAVQGTKGALLLEFGNDWCGHRQAAQPLIEQALAGLGAMAHLKVADDRGLPLGRAYRVKLWPTLLFLADGQEVARLVRPSSAAEIESALRATLPDS